jgi:hypothetical protein
MGGVARQARVALATRTVDFSDNPLADKPGICTLLNDAHELMTQNATKPHVAPHDLHVRVADAGQPHLDQGLSNRGRGPGMLLDNPQLAVIEQSAH